MTWRRSSRHRDENETFGYGRHRRIDYHDLPDKKDSALDMIRVACYVKEVDRESALRIIAWKRVTKRRSIWWRIQGPRKNLDEALEDLSKSEVPVVYVVDSFGPCIRSRFIFWQKNILRRCRQGTSIHTHNNLQLAFANTIEAIIAGVNRIDATIMHGQGAGNCPLELLLSFLKNPKFDIRPIIEVIQELFIPLKAETEWGYHIPYLVTACLTSIRGAASRWCRQENADCANFMMTWKMGLRWSEQR